VGTGKTTVCRALLEQLPENVDAALLLSPPKTWQELLLAIADELHIFINNRDASQHEMVYMLTRRLLENYGQGRRTVVIIDEAQNINHEVLEQVRLLTNLETHTDKLLHVFLVGQPELRDLLMQPSLRQVAQRITARYHLEPLSVAETQNYVNHRLTVAGARQGLFSNAALQHLHHESKGIPRVINILCDRALLGAFASDKLRVTSEHIRQAARQWRGERQPRQFLSRYRLWVALAVAGLLGVAALSFAYVDKWKSGILIQPVRAAQTQLSAHTDPPRETRGVVQSSSSAPAVLIPSRPEVADQSPPAKDAGTVTNEAQPMPNGLRSIGPGSPPHAVRWLRHELDRIEGTVSSEDGPLFDDQLRTRVMALQQRSGLVVDGIVGPHTLKYMQLIYGTSVSSQVDSSRPGS